MSRTHTEFHFSPRTNRAHEIAWRPWGEEAFDEARRADKPVLLAISAVWCHWCHVMDETSYSDPAIIAAINERYVPVRVDNDRRPDVNARYNQGGWPTTAFLSPGGALLTGATYLPPEQMHGALDRIAEFYRTNRSQIEERSSQASSSVRPAETSGSGDLRESMVTRIVEEIAGGYDEQHGGFGTEPKFPMADALDFLLQEYRITGETRLYGMVAKSMLGMAGGGMYDHVEGGFFRYSTTRDWSVPHFEKMTEDHAALLRVLATLTRITHNDRFRSTLQSALSYIRTVLRDTQTCLFAGSQDADETYYALPLDERRTMQEPYVDRTSYSNWTAAMAGSFILAGDALEDDAVAAEGMAALDALHGTMRDEAGLLYHYLEPGGAPSVRGLLTDQSAYLRALLDAHEYTGEARFLERARDVAISVQGRFSAEDGGFYDHAAIEAELGSLSFRDRPVGENALLAESFMRLASLDADETFRAAAERTLLIYVKTYGRAGTFAASYGRAVRRFAAGERVAVLVGSPEQTAELREAAHALPDPLLVVRTLAPSEAGAAERRGIDPAQSPVAYLCRGNVCGAPAREGAGLRDSYERLRSNP